jgi:hypothetical protein
MSFQPTMSLHHHGVILASCLMQRIETRDESTVQKDNAGQFSHAKKKGLVQKSLGFACDDNFNLRLYFGILYFNKQ